MKKLFFIFSFVWISIFAFAQIESVIPNPPNPPRLVNDYTGSFIDEASAQQLENKLVAYDDSTSNQIAVVIVNDLQGYSIGDYATALGRKWGVGGQKQFNNGIVLLVLQKPDNHGDVFIATGYGLEGAVPDVVASDIIQKIFIPNMRSGNKYAALDETTTALMQAAQGRYTAPDNYHEQKGKPSFFIIIILIIIVFVVLSIINRKGGGGGGYMSRRGYRDNFPGWIFLPGLGGGGRSGGSGWSGGGGGGGFGGFGGGSFGGGGAGGSW